MLGKITGKKFWSRDLDPDLKSFELDQATGIPTQYTQIHIYI